MLFLSLKRLFDLLVSASVLALFSPLLVLIALAIKLDDGGPILFVQDRVGKNRRIFRCYKFRTMVLGAETIGSGFTVTANDARITRVGRLLRLWTLDDSQLVNAFSEMSIVSPGRFLPGCNCSCR
jgi:lipopolysaccharide/colanic/teichoic acid biosynthesis glycosyltransferase